VHEFDKGKLIAEITVKLCKERDHSDKCGAEGDPCEIGTEMEIGEIETE